MTLEQCTKLCKALAWDYYEDSAGGISGDLYICVARPTRLDQPGIYALAAEDRQHLSTVRMGILSTLADTL